MELSSEFYTTYIGTKSKSDEKSWLPERSTQHIKSKLGHTIQSQKLVTPRWPSRSGVISPNRVIISKI